jgi:hypothetical protein
MERIRNASKWATILTFGILGCLIGLTGVGTNLSSELLLGVTVSNALIWCVIMWAIERHNWRVEWLKYPRRFATVLVITLIALFVGTSDASWNAVVFAVMGAFYGWYLHWYHNKPKTLFTLTIAK